MSQKRDTRSLSTSSVACAEIGKPAEKILLWLGWADKDYIASRRLLLKAYLPQGAALANTAIEKYFKALLLLAGRKVSRSHDISALHGYLLPLFPNLQEVNRTYLSVLGKAYQLRYFDTLKPGFSVSLAQAKLLVELDRTVHRIRQGFRFKHSSGKPVRVGIDLLAKTGEPDLVEGNCYFGNVDRQKVFEQFPHCYEMRVQPGESVLEIYYQATAVPDDGNFPLEGLIPGHQ
jgi:HEPN domain-containing protein